LWSQFSMASKKKRKIRTEFRKKHESRTRKTDLTRAYREHGFEDDESERSERVSGKGKLTRKRTVIGNVADQEAAGVKVHLEIDESVCRHGCVLSVHGLQSVVQADDGKRYRCATRQLLKSLSTDQRHVVAAGDRVVFRPEHADEGFIERIEPRHGLLCRTSKGRQHVIVAMSISC